jgi:hypothetical protein
MLAATRAVFEAGRGGAVWERHAPAVLMAYNGVIGALLRQEDRIHDGMADLPTLSENGQTAFLEWIPLVEQMRMVP